MSSSDCVQFDPDNHQDEFVQMNIEYITSLQNQLDETYQLDTRSILETSIEERARTTGFHFYRAR